jgi:hypothetical protein
MPVNLRMKGGNKINLIFLGTNLILALSNQTKGQPTERRKKMRYTTVLLAAVLVFASVVPVYSHHRGNLEVEIVSDRGDVFFALPYKEIEQGSTQVIKRYLEARKGENYSIVIRNNTSERVGVVIAVDGRNIITGKKSYLKNNEMMYLVDPYGYAGYEGWRTDNDTVHRFYFTDTKDSYAMRTFDDSSAMGVIAVAAFREKERPQVYFDRQMSREKAAPGAPMAPSEKRSGGFESNSAGTGFGDERYSPVVKVEFEPEAVPFEKMLVKYEWRETLCKKGLLNCRPEAKNRLWDESDYAPYPPGYSGR